MIRCLIVDDQQQSIDSLKSCINRMASLELVGTVSCSVEATNFMTCQNIQVLFAGIELCDGAVSEIVRQKTHLIVLNDEHSPDLCAIQQKNFLHCIERPVKFASFLNAWRRILEHENIERERINALANSLNIQDFIFVKTENKGKFVKILVKDICYIEGLGNYITIHTCEGGKTITYSTLTEIVDFLPWTFIRIHKSYVVSINFIQIIEGNQLKMSSKKDIPLGTGYRENLFQALSSKLIGGKVHRES